MIMNLGPALNGVVGKDAKHVVGIHVAVLIAVLTMRKAAVPRLAVAVAGDTIGSVMKDTAAI